MKFFIPPFENMDEMISLRERSIDWLQQDNHNVFRNNMIYAVEINLDGKNELIKVGDENIYFDGLVLMIFENNDDIIFCTTKFNKGGGSHHIKSKSNQHKIEYFNLDEYKYKEWTYALDDLKSHKVLHPFEEPKTVFKYYSNSGFNRDAVINSYLFCSHPYHLNDPMDFSSLLWDYSNLTNERYSAFFEMHDKPMLKTFKEDKTDNFNYIKSLFWEIRTQKSGIISLSSNGLNTLMWGHYSKENGFLVELDIQNVISTINNNNREITNYVFMPIQYIEDIESIDFFSKGFYSKDIPYLYALNIKKDDWKYENEWRLVCYSENFGVPKSIIQPSEDIEGKVERKVYYSKESVKSITLGQRFFCGKNLQEIIDNNIYKIKPENEDKSSDLEFINYLYENYNDKLYMCENFDSEELFKRKRVKITLEKSDNITFKLRKQ